MAATFDAHRDFTGVRTIDTEQAIRELTATLYSVRKTMQKLGLEFKYRRAFKRTTISDDQDSIVVIFTAEFLPHRFQQRTCVVILPTFVPCRAGCIQLLSSIYQQEWW